MLSNTPYVFSFLKSDARQVDHGVIVFEEAAQEDFFLQLEKVVCPVRITYILVAGFST